LFEVKFLFLEARYFKAIGARTALFFLNSVRKVVVLFLEFLQVGRQVHVDPPNFGKWSLNFTTDSRVCHAAQQQSDTMRRTPPRIADLLISQIKIAAVAQDSCDLGSVIIAVRHM
jgi:hypothetical protein